MEHIKKIHNTIFACDRIITYKSAAAILNVNVNEAKKCLEKYVHDIELRNEIIHVSYVIGGITLTDHNKIRIVPQNKYEKTKAQFKTITINHIYSIQKAPLIDWTPISNVDDLIYDNITPTEAQVKQEVITKSTETKSEQTVNKKGGIANFFNNTNQKKTTNNQSSKIVETEKPKKQEKNIAFTKFFSTNNKENVGKANGNVKIEKNDSDDEEILKVNKKRTRVLNDDDDDDEENPTKCAKVDILDDPVQEDPEEFHSDEDIFGSPEKDEELMKDSESTEKDSEISIPETRMEINSETTEDIIENSETMYEDNEGYFVTEKKKTGKKSIKKVTEKELNKKQIEEKDEKKNKKEIVQKIKNNTNQKSILNFFQKK